MVLHWFPNWVSSIFYVQLMSIRLFVIPMLWYLSKFYPLQHSLVDVYSISLNTPYLPSGSYMLPNIFFPMPYTSYPCSKILIFTSLSMIPTFVVFIDWIVSSKLIILMENNIGSITKMIFYSSSVMPLW